MLLRRSFTILIATVALAGISPARADGGFGSIGGVVTDGTATLQDMCVDAFGLDGSWMGSSTTGPDGSYSIEGLEPGRFKVHVADCSAQPAYVAEWFDDQADLDSADPVEVRPDDSTRVDVALTLGGRISGVVTDAASGEPIAGLCVSAYTAEYEWVSAACSDAFGRYAVGAIPTGSVKVEFGASALPPVVIDTAPGTRAEPARPPASEYIPEWWNDRAAFEVADPIAVIGGAETPGVDAALRLGGRITGTVTNTDGDGVGGMCVDAYDGGSYEGSGWTDGDGSYRIDRLPTSTYTVQFSDCGPGIYRQQWYDGQPSRSSADVFAVTEGRQTSGIDAVMRLRPRPDAAVSDLSVAPVPLTTDVGTAPGAGFERRVRFTIADVGTAPADIHWYVWAQQRTDYRVQFIGEGWESDFLPRRSVRRTVDWHGFGSVGDVTIHVLACASDDMDRTNDETTARSYVIAGGTGAGYSLNDITVAPTCEEWTDPAPIPID